MLQSNLDINLSICIDRICQLNQRVSMEENKTSFNKIDVRKKKILIQNAKLKKIIYQDIDFSNWLSDFSLDYEYIDSMLEEGKKSYLTYLKINQNSNIDQIEEEFYLDNNFKKTSKLVWIHVKYMDNGNGFPIYMEYKLDFIITQISYDAHEDSDQIRSSQKIDACDLCNPWDIDLIVVVVYK